MEFKKIQLNGFKSFSEKTDFIIEMALQELLDQTDVVNLISWNLSDGVWEKLLQKV